MNDFFDLLDSFSGLFNDVDLNDNAKTYDLSTKEGYEEFKKAINELKNNDTAKAIIEMLGIDCDELLDNLESLGSDLAEKSQVNNKKENDVKQISRKEVDHSYDNKENDKQFNRPSSLLNVDQQLQLHKIVQEYIDTMIKPYNNNVLTNNQINDAYAGLYEFAAWIMNR